MSYDLAAALLRDVPRYDTDPKDCRDFVATPDGGWLNLDEVLAALTDAIDGVDERAGEVLEQLRSGINNMPLTTLGGVMHGEPCLAAADLITALLAQNAALRAERDEVLKAYKIRLFSAEAERDALRSELEAYRESHLHADKQLLQQKSRAEAAEAEVEKLREAVWLKVGECLAGTTHAEVSPAARRWIEKAIRAALTTEAGE